MATTFPSALDAFANPGPNDTQDSPAFYHDVQHDNINDAMVAVQALLGINGSAVTTSHAYQLAGLIGSGTPSAPALSALTINQLVGANGLTLNGGIQIASKPPIQLTQTWNNAAVQFTAIAANITNTASNSLSKLIDLQIGGVTVFKVDIQGIITANGASNAQMFLNALSGNAIWNFQSAGSTTFRFYGGSSGNLVMNDQINGVNPLVYSPGSAGTGFITLANTTPSTSPSTGTLVVGGGGGFGGSLSLGGGINAQNYTYGTALIAYGDSITVGQGASPSSASYVSLLGAARNWATTNDGVSGTEISDQVNTLFYQRTVVAGDVYSLLTGFNDMRNYGNSANDIAFYKQMLYASLAWLAIPDAYKIKAQSGSVTYGGTWASSALYGGALSKSSSTNGSTATVTVRGSTVLLGFTNTDSSTGTLSVAIDGGAATVYSCGGFATSNNYTTGPNVVVIRGLTNAQHSVVITVGGSGACVLDWIAGLGTDVFTYNAPRVLVGNCLRMNATGYAVAPANGSDDAVAAFNVAIAATVNDLAAAGPLISLVDACNVYEPETSDVYSDNIHPSNTGHARIANAFIAVAEESPRSKSNLAVVGPFSVGGPAQFLGSVTAVSAIINQAVGAAGLTVNGGIQTTSQPLFNGNQTWNNSGTTFVGSQLTITNTAAAAASQSVQITIGAVKLFQLDATGIMALNSIAANNAQLRLNSPTGQNSILKYMINGVSQYQLYANTSNWIFNDNVNSLNALTYTPGAVGACYFSYAGTLDASAVGTAAIVNAGGQSIAMQLVVGGVSHLGGWAVPSANTFAGNLIWGRNTAAADTAGAVGESIAGTNTSSYTNVTATATLQQVATISLTAGKWAIYAFGSLSNNSYTPSAGNATWCISTATASLAGGVEGSGNLLYMPSGNLGTTTDKMSVSLFQIVNVSTTTPYYLNMEAYFSGGNPQIVGGLFAIRLP